jgi:hypothetical protein
MKGGIVGMRTIWNLLQGNRELIAMNVWVLGNIGLLKISQVVYQNTIFYWFTGIISGLELIS